MSDLRLIYSTCSSVAEARRIARALVEARLAACCNFIPGMRSCYSWQGEICEDEETVLIIKTRQNLVDDAIAELRGLHEADLPCALSIAIEGGNADFIAWLGENCRQQ